MAERRMFAKTIIDSDAFLDIPLSTQALYFHLSMRADDDGFINNPKKIQRMIGCSDDDLKLLIAKRFIIPFESGIVVIKHWKIHNYIQKDRYKETVYTEEKAQLIESENKAYTLCIHDGYNLETQVRLGKDRLELGKDRLDSSLSEPEKENQKSKSQIDYDAIAEMYNTICTSLPKLRKMTEDRKKEVKKRISNDKFSIEDFKIAFEKAQASDFITAGWSNGAKANFDWIIDSKHFSKLLEGGYDNRENKQQRIIPDKNSIDQNYDAEFFT